MTVQTTDSCSLLYTLDQLSQTLVVCFFIAFTSYTALSKYNLFTTRELRAQKYTGSAR